MDERQTPLWSGRDDNGGGEDSTASSNSSASAAHANGNGNCTLDGNGVGQSGPGAKVRLMSTNRQEERQAQCESHPEDSLSRTIAACGLPGTSPDLHTSLVPVCQHSCEPNQPTTNGTLAQDEAIALNNTYANRVMGGLADPAIVDPSNPAVGDPASPVVAKGPVKGDVTEGPSSVCTEEEEEGGITTACNKEGTGVGHNPSQGGMDGPTGGIVDAGKCGEDGAADLEGGVRPVVEVRCETSNGGDVGQDQVTMCSDQVMRRDDQVTRCDDQVMRCGDGDMEADQEYNTHHGGHQISSTLVKAGSQIADLQVLVCSDDAVASGEKALAALEYLKVENNQLLKRLSESCKLHEEKANAFQEAIASWESKCFGHQEMVTSLEHQLKEEGDRSLRHQEMVTSLEHQLKEERDRSLRHQEMVTSLEHQLKEEGDKSLRHQEMVTSLEHQLKEERDRSLRHQEMVTSLEHQLKEEGDKSLRHQEMVTSLEHQLKEERDRSLRHQEMVTSLEHQLKEERDRSLRHQEMVTSLEHQLKEERDRSLRHQEMVKSKDQLLENERTKALSKIAELEKALAAKTDKIAKAQLEAQSEKEDLTSKLVVVEHEKKRADDELAISERKLKEAMKEQEKFQTAVKNLNRDIAKAQSSLEKSASEHQKQLTQVKEEVNSLNIKLKWAQGKLKTETEAHNECKAQLGAMTKKYQSAKEEGEQIRADLKAMIKQYQESEEMRSNSLGMKLKKTEDELKQQEQEIADQHQLHQLTLKELELIKSAHQITQQECQQLRARIADLTTKMAEQKAEMDDHIISVTKLKLENKRLTTKASGMDELNQQLESERSKVAAVGVSLSEFQQSYELLEKEVTLNKERERELLAFSEKLSSANAQLLAEKSGTEAKLSSLMEERQSLSVSLEEAQKDRDALRTELNTLTEQSQATISDISQQLASKSEAVEQLTLSLDDEREQNNALKKKSASNLKDLQKQLQQCQKRIEQLEASTGGEAPATIPVSLVSRTSSHESLDDGVVVLSSQPSAANVQHDDDVQVHVTQNSGELFRHLDHEKEVLVERLCVLKREAAKKQEKLDFFEEHIAQLTDEVKKKSKIIQDFVVREQTGAVTSPSHDNHKARRAQKGGVMASVFTGKSHHNEMTFELSLEINRKMQSVLEDALLKNIMLKENIDTLGNEIARLSALQQSQALSR